MREITSANIINALTKIFAIFGYPKTITADNGKQFQSREFRNYALQHGIRIRYVTPYWPSANGKVERFNRTIGKAVQCYHAEGKDWRKHIQQFLLQYRTTPHTITGVAPADILFQYKIPNGILTSEKIKPSKQNKEVNTGEALLKSKIKEKTDKARKAKHNIIEQGDNVLVKNIRRIIN